LAVVAIAKATGQASVDAPEGWSGMVIDLTNLGEGPAVIARRLGSMLAMMAAMKTSSITSTAPADEGAEPVRFKLRPKGDAPTAELAAGANPT